MNALDSRGAGTTSSAGGFKALLVKWFFRQAMISNVETLSEHFRLITLAGAGLKNVQWAPGQKIQLVVGERANRTYMPFSWDPIAMANRVFRELNGRLQPMPVSQGVRA